MLRRLGFTVPLLFCVWLRQSKRLDDASPVSTTSQAVSSISGAQTDTAVLGQAFHTAHEQGDEPSICVDEPTMRGNSVSTLSDEKDMSFNLTMLNTPRVKWSGGPALPVVSAEASANIATKHASTELSETHHLVWVGVAKKEVFVPNTLHLSTLRIITRTNTRICSRHAAAMSSSLEVHRGAFSSPPWKVEFFSS